MYLYILHLICFYSIHGYKTEFHSIISHTVGKDLDIYLLIVIVESERLSQGGVSREPPGGVSTSKKKKNKNVRGNLTIV